MKVVIGMILASFGLWASAEHLGQNIAQYWDVVAFLMVILGTISVAVVTLPTLNLKTIFREILNSVSFSNKKREKAIANSVEVLNMNYPTEKTNRLDKTILRDGIELAKLGFDSKSIENILTERVINYSHDCRSISSWLIGLSKYPPAFGLAGTIFGLTNLMRSLSQGADPKEIGLSMAIALVATLYGVLLSNLFINPIGERIKSNIAENEILCEISIKTILMLKSKTNLLEAQEVLNGYLVSSNKRYDFLSNKLLKAS
ncbi:motility protein A [Halobacteriovorax sp.]|uniref:motility protein A n=1 Tax=Halobacteriovorax sp. TaxID=2020862 RepID=UPI0035687F8F